MKEETNLIVNNIQPYGVLLFEYQKNNNPEKYEEVHVFRTNDYSGNMKESSEMIPKWFDVNNIPYDNMWPDDKHWMPYLLNKDCFEGYFGYNDGKLVTPYIRKANNYDPKACDRIITDAYTIFSKLFE